jgi:hypothetical protein
LPYKHPDEDKHQAPSSTPPSPLSLQDPGTQAPQWIGLPDSVVNIHQAQAGCCTSTNQGRSEIRSKSWFVTQIAGELDISSPTGTYPSCQRWFLPVSAGTYPSGQRCCAASASHSGRTKGGRDCVASASRSAETKGTAQLPYGSGKTKGAVTAVG